MTKRAYGTGTFEEQAPGVYRLRYRGKQQRFRTELAGKEADKAATRALAAYVEELDREEKQGPTVTLNKLLDLHLADLRRNNRKDVDDLARKIDKHLRKGIGLMDASEIKKKHLTALIDQRLAEGAAPATINRLLSAIRRAYHLGIEDEEIDSMPVVKTLPEDNARQGFVEEDVYRAILMALPGHAKMCWVFSYYVGLRKGELLRLQWPWVDWDLWQIAVPLSITKTKKQRVIPVYSEMQEFLKFAYQTRNPECPYIFQYRGRQLRSFRTAFENAREKLKLDELIFHDLRRTAARNMEREGIPRNVAKQVTGHRTDSMWNRYAIAAEKDLPEVSTRMTEYHARKRAAKANCGPNCGPLPLVAPGKEGPEIEAKYKQ